MSPNHLGGLLAAAALALAAGASHAALDTSAATDDHSINTPTAWWAYTGVSPASLASELQARQSRITDLEVIGVTSSNEPRFVARTVPNAGAYAVPAWWWYHGKTASEVAALLTQHNGRLIELEQYSRTDGQVRYAFVMVSNTGSAARSWSYLLNVTAADLNGFMSANNMRLIDLDSLGSGSSQRFNAVMVRNTGSDARPSAWYYGQTSQSIASLVTSFQGRVVKIDRQADGRYSFVQVKNTGADNSMWWHRYGFTSMGAVFDYANQYAARPVDIVSHASGNMRYYDAVFIDNANASTRRMRHEMATTFVDGATGQFRGVFEAYLKPVGQSPVVDLNSSRRVETASALKALHLLWQMKQVQGGNDTLADRFNCYDYPGDGAAKDHCPDPDHEDNAHLSTVPLGTGLTMMMADSDNRTTRGVVLRASGFDALNTLAAQSGLAGTTVRHDIGCGYRDPQTGQYLPASRRNDTTAADLVRLWEGVWQKTLLTDGYGARDAFLSIGNPASGGWADINAIIQQEANAMGKGAIATQFAAQLRRYTKAGGYGTCLGDPNDSTACGQKVSIRSWAGLLGIPRKSGGAVTLRWYGFATLNSDVPIDNWNSPTDQAYTSAHNRAKVELFRDEIRSALATW